MHTWRDFAKEVGIIVLGVLIALGAEQTVEALHWMLRVHEAETAMRVEMTQDDGPQAYNRLAQSPCITAQLDTLERALLDERDHGAAFHPATLIKPFSFTWDEEAWQAAQTSGATLHMSREQMFAWSGPYAILPAMNTFTREEDRDYAELASIAAAPPHPSDQLRTQLIALIYRARGDNEKIRHYAASFVEYARTAGVTLTAADKRSNLDPRSAVFANCTTVIDPPRGGG
jgi:hypothetical protein